MSNVKQFYTQESIQADACLWISKIDRGLSASEQRELVIWCEKSSKHYSTLIEMARHWDDAELLSSLSELFPIEQKHSKHIIFRPVAMAATVVLASLLSLNTFLPSSFIPYVPSYKELQLTESRHMETRVGESVSSTLSDGSLLQLNTNTAIDVRYTPDYRLITLLKGEAQFNVSKDNERPFIVVVGDRSFTALGTIFNIQKNNNEGIELLVTEGRVLVEDSQLAPQVLAKVMSENQPPAEALIVSSGQKSILQGEEQVSVDAFSLDQVQRDLAWQQGMLVFDGEPLHSALEEVSRYTATKFELTESDLSQLKVSGYFKAGDIDGLLSSLRVNFNIEHNTLTNNTIQLYTRAAEPI